MKVDCLLLKAWHWIQCFHVYVFYYAYIFYSTIPSIYTGKRGERWVFTVGNYKWKDKKIAFGYVPSGNKKIEIEIFKNHDLRIFRIITGTKNYLLVPICKKEKQQKKKEKKKRGRELSCMTRGLVFQEKRYFYGE